ncbi:3-hydroxyacyl-CoA dehydrogenase [Sphingobium sp. TA15]|uniref:enoyl-CoA hydratase n=1 Tax=Sphingobium indicum (strain DSM 16413 / CCM 7287 / MTCC 6362 / UT26 / NBRC 101211 / UT26S) TaxID=452662 RepID=D4Z8E0_SPHIU|nr:3-hydroxyacyl-CoA dehydrogenase NAD-binding domain-containing protein [Sphingobium indicum]BAI98759.1 3-hydroxyacyl-CoA dehydrogenase [Sphingobium indicum UT26S]BDD68807.1 3-hydroxyacyl-CoA dehydrogenase [Sphingobium sp. TA15]
MQHISIETGADGIALVRFDVIGRTMNTITAAFSQELEQLVERLKGDAAIKGAILTSGKDNGFIAGADLVEMEGDIARWRVASTQEELAGAVADCASLSRRLRAIETLGKPVVAAISGLALGGGMEVALACHYRVVADNPKIQLGFPEATIGLLPGAGGTQRLPRLIGLQAALPLLLQGKPVSPTKALELGFVDAVVPAADLIETAKAWLLSVGDPVARWDRKGFKLPGGAPYSSAGQQIMAGANAMLRSTSYGNYPAQEQILKAVFEGTQVPMDAGLRIESRRFLNTVQTPQAEAMVRTLFLSMQALGKGQGRATGRERFDPRKAGVLGAGMMGAGIAHAHALAGIDTVLIDVDQAAADKGKAHGDNLLDKAVRQGRLSQEKADAAKARICASTDYGDLAGADIVIEAVFENRALKAEVTRKAEAVLGSNAIFGSNTSTLPIDGLADASQRPESFVGIHFFSPVDRMRLVEIIRGKRTSDATIEAATDYVLRIGKVPIIVNDSRGFYTSRVFGTYIAEGYEMLAEGIAPAIIDNVGRMTGMPRGPLELSDDVALDLLDKVTKQTAADLGSAYVAKAQDGIVDRLVNQLGRLGRKNGRGVYDYAQDGSGKTLWAGLADLAPPSIVSSDAALVERIRLRLLYRQAIEAARCVDEGVIGDPRQADVGAILAWGFPAWTGGPLSFIDSVGAATFAAVADELARDHGDRFAIPPLLRKLAEERGRFYEAPIRQKAA